MRALLLTAAVAALASAAHAQVPAPAPDGQKLSLTIYNSNLALVEDVRSIDIAQGRSRLEFKDVSAAIRPETVALSAAGISIVEQNFDYDLLSPDKLMEKAVGREVQIVRTNPGNGQQVTETATVLAVNGGVVLRIGDRIEVLRDDGVPTRVIFDKVPENLRARPTLSVTVDSARGGARETRLSYLTNGLSWNADYVALFDEAKGALDLQGWITLTNQSGTSFADADAQLVAGDVNLVRNIQEYWQQQQYRNNTRGRGGNAGVEAGGQRSIADYYVYPLPQRTSIENNQTKQVSFLDAKGVRARKAYEYRHYNLQTIEQPQSADVVLEFANSSGGGLGAQLPAGIMRVYMRDQRGDPKFVGENRIDHTPQGSEISVKTGDAFDVTVQPTLTSQEDAGKWRTRYRMSYLVRNARPEPVTVAVRQAGLWGDGKMTQESIKGRKFDASTTIWDVPVPANGETTLTFTYETGW